MQLKNGSATDQPDNKSESLQNMDTLDVVVLVTSNIDCDLECKVPQESDFQVGQHRNQIWDARCQYKHRLIQDGYAFFL